MFRLDGKVALVTGCGTLGEGWGNGKATAAALARQGAAVFGCDLDIDAARQTAEAVAAEGGRISVRQCDVTRADEVAGLVQACMQAHGRIDILVNNVGRSEPGDPVSMAQETWNEQLQVNLTSAFLCCKHVIPLMKRAGGGSIINISSIAGLRYAGKPQVGYAAAKAALMQMTATTAVIHARDGVRLNCVVPGLMFTPLVQRLAQKYAQGDYEGFVARRHGQVPMGRMGDAWDVAHAVVFLASDESRYITGQQIVVDGGITMATA
ncbi:SDR family NAD(P)-dependent oxidoreductase [Bordetella hinzii]|uniref:3-oxoacyl-ACP reductase n=1 Tax=Bordetella hinzii TaxID=103855 RepID=A0AAN1VI47_9BORD|nr:SDR family oxidoreductase [Bordetella hinzii]AKQ59508.1 3-oxoacyl-[acyl-carrier-protein] reductase FabG [Bordetella hinzii]AZW19347.1 3-oxoacyl-ACP reductase [Bordetella hinzii]MBZ0073796.1 SDR family oxidoreductase [Bordetella hinzii]MBZ0077728.1 SDR family oxidoreductase [Bordetella hinzii]MBZ0082593.1 SDR family oxidoreductase [Bordetella hinzii]